MFQVTKSNKNITKKSNLPHPPKGEIMSKIAYVIEHGLITNVPGKWHLKSMAFL